MTVMPAGPVEVDSTLSYARFEGDALRVVLALPDDSDVAGKRLFVRFQGNGTGFRVPASLDRSSGSATVKVSVPRAQLDDGTWQLKLREGGGSPLRSLGARVLLHADQPVALLFGKTPNIT